MMVLLIGVTAALALSQQPSTTMSIRVVDPARAPLPGMTVRVVGVGDCNTLKANSESWSGITALDGTVDFRVPSSRAYLLMVDAQGGFEGQKDCLDRIPPGITYSQIQLRLDLSRQVTLLEPAVGKRAAPTALSVENFIGVYADAAGRLYEVSEPGPGAGLAVSLPEGGVLRFPKRDGVTFLGNQGTVTFRVEQGRVVGFLLARSPVDAKKRD